MRRRFTRGSSHGATTSDHYIAARAVSVSRHRRKSGDGFIWLVWLPRLVRIGCGISVSLPIIKVCQGTIGQQTPAVQDAGIQSLDIGQPPHEPCKAGRVDTSQIVQSHCQCFQSSDRISRLGVTSLEKGVGTTPSIISSVSSGDISPSAIAASNAWRSLLARRRSWRALMIC